MKYIILFVFIILFLIYLLSNQAKTTIIYRPDNILTVDGQLDTLINYYPRRFVDFYNYYDYYPHNMYDYYPSTAYNYSTHLNRPGISHENPVKKRHI